MTDNVFHLPNRGAPGPGWPVFDMPRSETGLGCYGERHVQESADLVMRVDATDEFITVPTRIVYTDDGLTGWTLEIGPYSIGASDACALANMLTKYGHLSGEFHRPSDAAR